MVNNRRIKSFHIEGELADDSFILGHREKMEKLLDMQMRDSGYVPHLDLDTEYYLEYDSLKETYLFALLAHSIYVGKKKAQEIVGISGTKYIYR